MTILLALGFMMIPPLVSEADLWCDSLGVDCEQIEQEQLPDSEAPEEIMLRMVVGCIQGGRGSDEEARACWEEVGKVLEED